jgi:hypothetical protein
MNADQYRELCGEVRAAYRDSEVQRHGWFYGICATKLVPDQPLIVGFNWGVDKKNGHEEPTGLQYPTDTFADLVNKPTELGSLARLPSYLNEYLKFPPDQYGQTNICFFRSESANQISDRDFDSCLPAFHRLLRFAQPSLVIALSSRVLKGFLDPIFASELETKSIQVNSRMQFDAARGTVAIGTTWVPIVAVPHPNMPCTKQGRRSAWEFGFPKGATP